VANPQGRGTITIEVIGEAALKRGIIRAQGLTTEAVEQIIHDAGEELLQLAQINLHRMKPPGIDTGALVQSLQVRHEQLSATVFSDLKYAPFIEFGTRPHFPPLQPILEWVKRKLHVPEKRAKGVAFMVVRKIGRRGTPPRPFLSNAFMVVRKRILSQMKAGVSTAIRQSGNQG